MLVRYWKVYAQLASVILVAYGGGLEAQTFALPFDLSESSPAVDFAVDANGNMLDRGPLTNTGAVAPVTTMTAGSQFLWSPAYAIFRAGYFSTALSTTNMGEYSVALGYNSVAQGVASTGIGGGTALGTWSMAIGSNSVATGSYSTALGAGSLAPASQSMAIAGGDSTAGNSVAVGSGSTASGANSTSVGPYTAATGYFASAFGTSAIANGAYSLALGYSSVTNANGSSAAGQGTAANSYCSFVTGTYNLDLSETGATPSLTAWVTTDPIFEVGNGQGTGSTPRSTALVVYKNGDVAFPITTSTVTANRIMMTVASGDIPMYTGN